MEEFDFILVPSIVRSTSKGATVEIPDLNMTIAGCNFVAAVANALEAVEALYTYRIDTNTNITFNETFDSLISKMSHKREPHFIHMLSIRKRN